MKSFTLFSFQSMDKKPSGLRYWTIWRIASAHLPVVCMFSKRSVIKIRFIFFFVSDNVPARCQRFRRIDGSCKRGRYGWRLACLKNMFCARRRFDQPPPVVHPAACRRRRSTGVRVWRKHRTRHRYRGCVLLPIPSPQKRWTVTQVRLVFVVSCWTRALTYTL